MSCYFDNEPMVERLEQSADSWVGTPFVLNSRVKGKGVSCHNLIIGIYEDLGIKLPFESPKGSGGVGDQTRLARVSEFLDDCGCFEKVEAEPMFLLPGDVISFQVKTGEYHVGMMLGPRYGQDLTFIHAIKPRGVAYSNLHDATYIKRLVSAWRLKLKEDWK